MEEDLPIGLRVPSRSLALTPKSSFPPVLPQRLPFSTRAIQRPGSLSSAPPPHSAIAAANPMPLFISYSFILHLALAPNRHKRHLPSTRHCIVIGPDPCQHSYYPLDPKAKSRPTKFASKLLSMPPIISRRKPYYNRTFFLSFSQSSIVGRD